MISAVVVVVVVVIKLVVIEMLLSLSSNNCMGTEGDHKMPHKEEVFDQLCLLSLTASEITKAGMLILLHGTINISSMQL